MTEVEEEAKYKINVKKFRERRENNKKIYIFERKPKVLKRY